MTDRARVARALAMIAGILGALALFAGDPYPGGTRPDHAGAVSYVGPVELARWIRDGTARVRVIDVRARSQFEAYHIPGAEHVAWQELRRRPWPREETVVVYADADARALEASRLLRTRGVEGSRILRGGLLTWIDSIVEPRLAALPEAATTEERAARREHLELSRYFGGLPVVSPASSSSAGLRGAPTPSRRSEAAAVGRVLRRGC